MTAGTAPRTPRTLVVNADDFGLTGAVSNGIIDAHLDGAVTSTSALAVAPAFVERSGALRDSGLPCGAHLCAVGEDPPVLTAAEVPSLVDQDGRFPMTWRDFLRRAARGAVDRDDLRREFAAQIDVIVGHGVVPTHVDTHQNLHLWPSVSDVVVELAADRSIPVLRVTRSRRRTPLALGVRALSRRAAACGAAAGLVVPDDAAGLDTAGANDEGTLIGLIELLGAGNGHADLTVHPGRGADPDRARYRWGYAWESELTALRSPAVRRAIHDNGFVPGSFRDLVDAVP